VETFVPLKVNSAGAPIGAACYATLPLTVTGSPAITSLPPILNPITQFIKGKGLYVCGRNFFNSKFQCFLFDGTSWTVIALGTLAVDVIPAKFLGFIYGGQMWIVSDYSPMILDLSGATFQNFWDTEKNPPYIPTNNQTEGGGCAVVVGDFVYLFGGANTLAVRRFYLKGLKAGTPGDALVPRKWEYLTDLPNVNVQPNCATVPTNRNQIMIELSQQSSTTASALIYDIYQNTFTAVPSTIDLGGVPLTELCHADPSPLYAFPYGNGAKVYYPTGTGNDIWPDVISTGSIPTTRLYPAVALVPKAFVTSIVGCNGC
jgi:hypothetical protein